MQGDSKKTSLNEYYKIAEQVISKYAPGFMKKKLTHDIDSVGYVVSKLINADESYSGDNAQYAEVYRRKCGRWAVIRLCQTSMLPKHVRVNKFKQVDGLENKFANPFKKESDGLYDEVASSARTELEYLIFNCIYQKGMSYSAVGEIVGMNPSKVEHKKNKIINRIRQEHRKKLEDRLPT